jgi:uncharacterized membrane protein YgaE (UPF0421/DUF939 family)
MRVAGIQLAVRASVGASIALGTAQLVGLQYPVFAFIAAVIATDLTPAQTRELGVGRVLATLVGAATGATLTLVLPPAPWAVGASIIVAMLFAEFLGASGGSRIAGYICGLLVIEHPGDAWHYGFFRLLETALGVTVAWLISYVPKLMRADDLEA